MIKKKIIVFMALIVITVLCGAFPLKASASNLALGQLVNVSDFISGFGGANAVDGDYSTYWNATDFGYSSNPNFLTVDLGNLFNVNRIKLVSGYNGPAPGNTGYGFRNIFNIYTSPDNTNWTYQYSGEIADADPGRIDDRSFSPISLRYVKYEEIGGDSLGPPLWNIHWSNLAEMEVYDINSVIPEPATISLLGLGLLGLWRMRRKKNV